jgi:hypothetical protein
MQARLKLGSLGHMVGPIQFSVIGLQEQMQFRLCCGVDDRTLLLEQGRSPRATPFDRALCPDSIVPDLGDADQCV